jgi:IclR family pca regulon transcriptional regulator
MLLAQLPEDELKSHLDRVKLERHTEKSIYNRAELHDCISKVRAQGYCIVDQELDSGLRSLAVPAFDAKNKLLGAINISTNASRISLDTLHNTFLPLLQDKARLIHANVS